jgi:ribokinase
MDATFEVCKMVAKGSTVEARSYQLAAGGKGGNQAVAAAFFGAEVSIIGAVGNDESGSVILKTLQKHGVNTDYVTIIQGIPTGTAVIFVDSHGDNCITVYPGANRYIPRDQVIPMGKGDLLVAQLEINADAVEYFFGIARKIGMISVLNPSPVEAITPELLSMTDILVANEHEASTIGNVRVRGIPSAKACCLKLLEKGPSQAIVTLGASGSVYAGSHGTAHFSCPKVEPIDTQGAGDMFLGTLAARLSLGDMIEQAIQTAHISATSSITKKGSTQASLPERKCVMNSGSLLI